MKKKIIAIGIIGMFLLTSITAMSAIAEEESEPVQVYGGSTADTVRLYGYVTNKTGLPVVGATMQCIEFPWLGIYYRITSTDSSGYYEFTDVPRGSKFSVYAQKPEEYYVQQHKIINTYSPDIDEIRLDFVLYKLPRTRDIPGSIAGNIILEQVSQQSSQQQSQSQSTLLSGGQSNNN